MGDTGTGPGSKDEVGGPRSQTVVESGMGVAEVSWAKMSNLHGGWSRPRLRLLGKEVEVRS